MMRAITRVLPYIGGALGLIALLSRFAAFAGPLAAVLACCVAVGLLHASGRFTWIDRYPLAARALDAYAPRPWRARAPLSTSRRGAQGSADPPPKPVRPPIEVKDIASFVGIDEQIKKVRQLIQSQAFRSGGNAPIIIALVGALGTGKASVGRNIPGWLYKEGVIKSREVRLISRETLPGLAETGGLALDTREEIRQLAQESLGGVLLVEHIDRLNRGQKVSSEIGECLADVAAQFPVRLIVVITGSLAAYRALDPDDRWRHNFNIYEIEFEDLYDDALSQIFLRSLNEKKLTLDPAANPRLRRRIKDLKDQNTPNFRNAVTMGRLVGAILAAKPHGEEKVIAKDIGDARLPI